MIPFERLVCAEQTREDFERIQKKLSRAGKPCVLGCVVSLDRSLPLVRTVQEELRAELTASIKKSEDSIVAVGDWVALWQPKDHERAVIECVLPRRSEIARVKRIGRERQPRRQVLAANVDSVLICQSLTGEGVDMRLLVRQMAAVAGCGARPVFVLTKSDLVDEGMVASTTAHIAAVAPDVPTFVISSLDADSVELVRSCCKPGTVVMLLGESGVGKSSLVNALLGEKAAEVGDVRSSDDKGRHTTVARRMLACPDGGILIDAPGLRTLQILDMKRSLRRAFSDVEEAALGCRFRDCTHTDEPGCVVREEISPERLAAYRALASSKQFA